MEKQASQLQKRRRAPFIGLFYLIAYGILFVIFPGKGRFPYEFEQGRPWLRGEIYAPYDIPLRKTEEEIRHEKDSLSRFAPYYFKKNELIQDESAQLLTQWFSDYLQHLDSLGKTPEVLQSQTLEQGLALFREVYETGIIELPEEIEEKLFKTDSSRIALRVIRNNVAEYAELRDFYSPKTAFEKVHETLHLNEGSLWNDFLDEVNISDALLPNITYDEETSRNIRNETLRNVSLTKGIWPEGRIIISRGETVTPAKFIILSSYREEFENRTGFSGNHAKILTGQGLILALFLGILFLYFWFYEPLVFYNFKQHGFILIMVTITLMLAGVTSHSAHLHLYLVPFTLLPVILQTFFSSRITAIAYAVTILLTGFFAPAAFEFIVLNFAAGAVAIFSAKGLYRRNILFRNAFLIFLTYNLTYLALYLLQDGDLRNLDFNYPLLFAISAGFYFLTYSLIFIFEKLFGFLSDVRLMELLDTNQPLLRHLSETAPGTFQHSLQVGNLAEAVVREIGGNPLLVRAGAMYHDIGKIKNPQYFIENVSGENPHKHLHPEESSAIILQHVTDGMELAQKHGLPSQIADFIQSHHGTSLVQFFYKTYTREHPGETVDIQKFTYKGPDPFSIEMVVLMMCDACEAASHSLPEKNQETLEEMVHQIVEYQMEHKYYMNADITCRAISRASEIIIKKLMNIYHVRIAYPK